MSDPQSIATSPGIINAERYEREMQKEFVLDFISKSNQLREQFRPVWDEILENYMVVPFGSAPGHTLWPPYLNDHPSRYRLADRNDIRLKDPETHQIIETLTGQALGLLLGSPGYITAVPIGIGDPEKGRMISRILMALLEQPGVYRTHYQLFKNAFTFGTAILEIGWDTKARDQVIQIPSIGPDGRLLGWDLAVDEVVYRNQPLQREVSLWDWYPDPGGTRVQEDMSGVAKRFRLSKPAARALGDSGTYDAAAVRAAILRAEADDREREQKQAGAVGPLPNLSREVARMTGRIPGFEYWGEIPWRPRAGDRSTNRVITLWGDEIVRSHINPYTDGMKPFFEVVVNPIQGRHYGLSPAEVIRFLQDSLDNMLNLATEAANLAVRPVLIVSNAFAGNTKALQERRFNSIIQGNPEQVKALESDMNSLQFAMAEIVRRKMHAREAVGATNPLQAIPGPVEKSATESSELVRMASQKVEVMVNLIERDQYPQIGRCLHSRLRQFAMDDQYVATLGGDSFTVGIDQIDVDADIRFVGSRQSQSKFQRSVQYREALAVLTPEALMTVPDVVESYLREVLDFPDAKQIVVNALQRIMMLQGLKQAGAAPPQGAGQGPGTEGSRRVPKKSGEAAPESEGGQAEFGGKRMA